MLRVRQPVCEGSLVGSFGTPRTLFDAPTPLNISAPFPFNGFIDELRITKGARSVSRAVGCIIF
jgi:hypothetical protein